MHSTAVVLGGVVLEALPFTFIAHPLKYHLIDYKILSEFLYPYTSVDLPVLSNPNSRAWSAGALT